MTDQTKTAALWEYGQQLPAGDGSGTLTVPDKFDPATTDSGTVSLSTSGEDVPAFDQSLSINRQSYMDPFGNAWTQLCYGGEGGNWWGLYWQGNNQPDPNQVVVMIWTQGSSTPGYWSAAFTFGSSGGGRPAAREAGAEA